MEDKREELLQGDKLLKAFNQCFYCKWITECEYNNWPIHTDEDGNCKSYIKE